MVWLKRTWWRFVGFTKGRIISDLNMQPPGGHFHMNLFGMCLFSGLKIDQKFRNGL